jgi:hypothetical protein
MSGNQQPQAGYVVQNWFSKGKDQHPIGQLGNGYNP